MSDSGEAEQVLDPRALARLRRLGGESLVFRVVEYFLESSRLHAVTIRDGALAGDLEAIGRASHSLRTSAANVGAAVVRRIAGQLERCALDDRLDAARDHASGLDIALFDADRELSAVVARKGVGA